MNIKRRIRLGEVLVQHGAISEEQLQSALVQQRRTGRKLGRVLADLGFMSETSLHEFLSKHLQVPFFDLKHARVEQETVKLLAEPLARRYRAIVLLQDARGLLVGMADPSDLHAYDELQAKLKQPIRLALVGEADLLKTLDAVYRQTDEIASLAEAVRDDLRESDVDIEHLSRGRELARRAGHQAAADHVQRRRAGARLRHPHRTRRAEAAHPAARRRRACRNRSSTDGAWRARWSPA